MAETTTREILQLLKEWGVWHAAFGGAISPDEAANMVDAAYGPGGFIETGMEYFRHYPRSHIKALAESYEALDEAINEEKRHDEGFIAWLLLHEPYFGDPGDWTVVERKWRKADDNRIKRHDIFVERLRRRLANTRLYPIWPKPLSEKEEKSIEAKNAEIYATYQRIRNAGNTHNASVAQTAAYFQEAQADLSTNYVERIIEFRDTLKLPQCMEPGCDREPQRGTLCMKHYQQQRRRQAYRENKNAS